MYLIVMFCLSSKFINECITYILEGLLTCPLTLHSPLYLYSVSQTNPCLNQIRRWLCEAMAHPLVPSLCNLHDMPDLKSPH